MPSLPTVGGSNNTWGTELNAFLNVAHAADGTLATSIAGNGLAISSGVLSVGVDGSTLEVSGDALRVKDAGVTAAKVSTTDNYRVGSLTIAGAMSSTAKKLHVVGDIAIEYGNSSAFFERAGSGLIINRNDSAVPSGITYYGHMIIQGLGNFATGLNNGVGGIYLQARDRSDVAKVAVSNATNASPIVLTTATHPWVTGQQVTVSGVGGNTAANGTWTITVTNSTTFSLNGSTGNGAYTSGGSASNRGSLNALNCSVFGNVPRDSPLTDDMVPLMVNNDSTSANKGTEGIYFGHNTAFTAGAPEFTAGIGMDCNATFGFRGVGTYDYCFEAGGAGINQGVLRGPNNANLIVSRNAALNADVVIAKYTSSDALQLMTGGQNIGVWGTTAPTPSNAGGRAFALVSTTAGVYPEHQIIYNSSTGGFADFNMVAGTSLNQQIRILVGGGKGRVYTITNHPLTLGSNNVEDVLSISSTAVTVKEAINIVLGTTTGTKIGTATTQKIGFWNKTPVVQPAAYTPTNVSADRSYDANATTIDELSDVLGTLIADLQSIGLIG